MLRAIATVATVAVAFVRPAHAEFRARTESEVTAALAVRRPERAKLDGVKLAVDGPEGTATLTFALSSREAAPHAATMMIDVPRGARVTRMWLTMADEHLGAKPVNAIEASERFREIVERRSDPALLELAGSTRNFDRLRLSVFPLSKKVPARIDIAFELPDIAALELEVSTHATVELDDKVVKGRRIELPRRPHDGLETVHVAPRAHVNMMTSLFATETVAPVVVPAPSSSSSCGTIHTVSSKDVRRQVKLALARIRYCYMREAQRDPKLEGTADLHFLIDHDGKTRDITIAGTIVNREVKTCLAAEVASWTFMPGDTLVQINYPLVFRLAD